MVGAERYMGWKMEKQLSRFRFYNKHLLITQARYCKGKQVLVISEYYLLVLCP